MRQINTSLPISGYWDTRQGGRAENQDSCGFIDTPLGFVAIVCDGMGGGPSGQLASSTAVQKIVEYIMNAPEGMSRSEVMKNAIEYAHHTILQMGTQKPALRGMGTTVAAVLVNDYSAIIAHVGDSRVYQFRWKRKIFRTADHSMVGELVRNGTLTEEQARLSSQSNIITKALGGNLTNLAEVTERPYEKGDRFMICSDGIWGMMPEKELIRRTAKTPSLSGAVDGTVVEVDEIGRNEGNTHDNLTIAMLEMNTDSKLKEKMSKKSLIIIGILAALFLMSMAANLVLGYFLLSPTPEGQKIEVLEQQIETDKQKIESLNKEIEKQKNATIDAKGEAAEAKDKAAEAKMKVAEQKTKEAEQKAKEADQKTKEAEQKTSNQQKGGGQSNEITNRINSVIVLLEKASKMNESQDRIKLRQDAISNLRVLVKKDPAHKTTYEWVITELGKKISTQPSSQSVGQYNSLISKLRTLTK